MLQLKSIETKVITEISDISGIEPAAVQGNMTLLCKELGLDSLKMIRLLLGLDEMFPNCIDISDLGSIGSKSIDEIINHIFTVSSICRSQVNLTSFSKTDEK
jgi:acyl carrier protein